MSTPLKLRPCVRRFAEQIELHLRASQFNWRHGVSPEDLVELAGARLHELDKVVGARFVPTRKASAATGTRMVALRALTLAFNREIADSAADAGAHTMMVADLCDAFTEDSYELGPSESDDPEAA